MNMSRAPISPLELSAGAAFENELAAAPNPAWVIDAAQGRVLAANKAGALRLGLGRESTAALEETMPALARLREIQSRSETAEGGDARERLAFWTRNGLENLTCLVTRTGATPDAPLLVQLVETNATDAPAPQDDAATLVKIADAIRTGLAERRAAAEHAAGSHAVANDEQTAPAPPAPDPGRQAVELARLAHELKTPLSAIAAAAEIMKDERFGPIANARYGGYVADIHASARHALAVINSMLGKHEDVTESAEPDLVFTEIDLADLAGSTVSAMRPIAEQAGLALACEGEPHLPHIIADATAVKQMLLNLLTNAVKFTGAGGRITVRTRHAADGSLRLSVHDTGLGISDEEIARVRNATGQPVPRMPATGSTKGGLGLGLPLVKMLAAANGAELIIQRPPEGGTAIIIAFSKSRVVPV